MIEITTAVVEKVQTLMHENAGFIMSKNVERILGDLAKQAEVFGVSMTSIPVTMKMTISVDDFGVHLTFDSVTWQKTMRASDKACYTVDYDPRQPNLPGFDQADQPEQPEKQQPVIDVKALPEHEDDGEASDSESEKDLSGLKELLDGEQFLKVACSTNLEGAADAQAMKIFAPLPSSDNRVAIYASGSWKTQIVPNVKSALEAADDGNNIVFGPDGQMTHQTMISLSTSGFGIAAVYRTLDGHLIRKESMDGVTFVEREELDDNENDRRYLLDELKSIMKNDDCLLMFQAEFYGFDGLK